MNFIKSVDPRKSWSCLVLVQIEEYLANGSFADLKKDPEAEEKKTEDASMALKFL